MMARVCGCFPAKSCVCRRPETYQNLLEVKLLAHVNREPRRSLVHPYTSMSCRPTSAPSCPDGPQLRRLYCDPSRPHEAVVPLKVHLAKHLGLANHRPARAQHWRSRAGSPCSAPASRTEATCSTPRSLPPTRTSANGRRARFAASDSASLRTVWLNSAMATKQPRFGSRSHVDFTGPTISLRFSKSHTIIIVLTSNVSISCSLEGTCGVVLHVHQLVVCTPNKRVLSRERHFQCSTDMPPLTLAMANFFFR